MGVSRVRACKRGNGRSVSRRVGRAIVISVMCKVKCNHVPRCLSIPQSRLTAWSRRERTEAKQGENTRTPCNRNAANGRTKNSHQINDDDRMKTKTENTSEQISNLRSVPCRASVRAQCSRHDKSGVNSLGTSTPHSRTRMLVSCRIVGPTAYEEYVATLPVGTLGWIAASSLRTRKAAKKHHQTAHEISSGAHV